MQKFDCNWYAWCVNQAFLFAKQKDHSNWLRWWCLRNKFKHNLTDKEIECYYKFKLKEKQRLQKELIAKINGRPKIVIVNLKTNC